MARRTKIIDRRLGDNPVRDGFTLAESLIASVVLAIAVIGIAQVLAASYKQTVGQSNMVSAIDLARELMEEIASKPIDAPSGTIDKAGWSGGVTDRTQYDTIDDFNGYTDSSSSVKANDGTTINLNDGGAYTRSVAVTSNAIPSGMTGTSSDFKLVTVTVTLPHSESVKIAQLFVRATIQR